MLSPGAQIGNYVIEQELGCGGMARIYRVRHAVLQTQFALKVLEPAYRERSELRARFLSEAMIGAKLHHPHIVRVTDTISTPEVAGIVMELVRGPNLETYIRSLSKPPSAENGHAAAGGSKALEQPLRSYEAPLWALPDAKGQVQREV